MTREPGDLPTPAGLNALSILTVGAGIMNTQVAVNTANISISQRLIAGVLALCIGLVLIGGVGFASDMAIHNGAHDTRHSLGFPCH